jgi:hypothetical protein
VLASSVAEGDNPALFSFGDFVPIVPVALPLLIAETAWFD